MTRRLEPRLQNALAQHAGDPFRAIIASANPTAHVAVLLADDVTDTIPLIEVPQDAAIAREAPSLVAAMKLLLQSADTVLFVDAYYDPFNSKVSGHTRRMP